jgi:hypothetical protein
MSAKKYFTKEEIDRANREKVARYYQRNKTKIKKERMRRYWKSKTSSGSK